MNRNCEKSNNSLTNSLDTNNEGRSPSAPGPQMNDSRGNGPNSLTLTEEDRSILHDLLVVFSAPLFRTSNLERFDGIDYAFGGIDYANKTKRAMQQCLEEIFIETQEFRLLNRTNAKMRYFFVKFFKFEMPKYLDSHNGTHRLADSRTLESVLEMQDMLKNPSLDEVYILRENNFSIIFEALYKRYYMTMKSLRKDKIHLQQLQKILCKIDFADNRSSEVVQNLFRDREIYTKKIRKTQYRNDIIGMMLENWETVKGGAPGHPYISPFSQQEEELQPPSNASRSNSTGNHSVDDRAVHREYLNDTRNPSPLQEDYRTSTSKNSNRNSSRSENRNPSPLQEDHRTSTSKNSNRNSSRSENRSDSALQEDHRTSISKNSNRNSSRSENRSDSALQEDHRTSTSNSDNPYTVAGLLLSQTTTLPSQQRQQHRSETRTNSVSTHHHSADAIADDGVSDTIIHEYGTTDPYTPTEGASFLERRRSSSHAPNPYTPTEGASSLKQERVAKVFCDKIYYGSITQVWEDEDGKRVWHVKYDDKDQEDIMEPELQKLRYLYQRYKENDRIILTGERDTTDNTDRDALDTTKNEYRTTDDGDLGTDNYRWQIEGDQNRNGNIDHDGNGNTDHNDLKTSELIDYFEASYDLSSIGDITADITDNFDQNDVPQKQRKKRKAESVPCQHCGRFYSANGIKTHEKNCDSAPTPKNKVVACQHCGKFYSVHGITRHEKFCRSSPNAPPTKAFSITPAFRTFLQKYPSEGEEFMTTNWAPVSMIKELRQKHIRSHRLIWKCCSQEVKDYYDETYKRLDGEPPTEVPYNDTRWKNRVSKAKTSSSPANSNPKKKSHRQEKRLRVSKHLETATFEHSIGSDYNENMIYMWDANHADNADKKEELLKVLKRLNEFELLKLPHVKKSTARHMSKWILKGSIFAAMLWHSKRFYAIHATITNPFGPKWKSVEQHKFGVIGSTRYLRFHYPGMFTPLENENDPPWAENHIWVTYSIECAIYHIKQKEFPNKKEIPNRTKIYVALFHPDSTEFQDLGPPVNPDSRDTILPCLAMSQILVDKDYAEPCCWLVFEYQRGVDHYNFMKVPYPDNDDSSDDSSEITVYEV